MNNYKSEMDNELFVPELNTYHEEVGIAMADHPAYDFDNIHTATKEAIKEFQDLARDTHQVEVKVNFAEFVECDSGNMSHATAHFHIEYQSKEELDVYGDQE